MWAGSSDGRSSPWHGGGPGFKSRSVHSNLLNKFQIVIKL